MEIISKSASEPQHKPEHAITRYIVWHQRAKWHNTTPGRKEDREGRGEGRRKMRGKKEEKKERRQKIQKRREGREERKDGRIQKKEGRGMRVRI